VTDKKPPTRSQLWRAASKMTGFGTQNNTRLDQADEMVKSYAKSFIKRAKAFIREAELLERYGARVMGLKNRNFHSNFQFAYDHLADQTNYIHTYEREAYKAYIESHKKGIPDEPLPSTKLSRGRIKAKVDSVYKDLEALGDQMEYVGIELQEMLIKVGLPNVQLVYEGHTYNFGEFEIQLPILEPRKYTIHAKTRQYLLEGYEHIPHPHIKHNSLCEGDAKDRLTRLFADNNFYDGVTLIDRTIRNYNPRS